MTFRSILTPAQIQEAEILRGHGRGWDFLGERYGCNPETVKRALDPGYRAQRAAQISRNRHRGESNPMVATRAVEIPDAVLAEAATRANSRRSLTSLLCGDPAPGQSALDKKRGGAAP